METIDPLFEELWLLYGKKVSRTAAIKAWQKLTVKDRLAALAAVQDFVAATPDVKFRPYPSTYLNQRRWEDDLSALGQPSPTKADPFKNVFNEKRDNYNKTNQ